MYWAKLHGTINIELLYSEWCLVLLAHQAVLPVSHGVYAVSATYGLL